MVYTEVFHFMPELFLSVCSAGRIGADRLSLPTLKARSGMAVRVC